jgi:hypothetical protein
MPEADRQFRRIIGYAQLAVAIEPSSIRPEPRPDRKAATLATT